MRQSVFAALILVFLGHGAGAAERPDAESMGKLLAYTVNCGCVVGEQDWILGVYRELFTDAYGETYADALQAPLQGALKDGWDRNMSLCKRICEQPVVRELQQSLARADGGGIDGSAIRSELGPAPEDTTVSAEAASAPAEEAPAEVEAATGKEPTVVPQAAPEEAGAVAAEGDAGYLPMLPAYCVWRQMAKGCMPEDRPSDVSAPGIPTPSTLAAAPAADGAPTQVEQSPELSADMPEPVAPATATQDVDHDREPSIDNETLASERAGDTSALYETAGTGDNWSSSLCRTSPSRPDCRKFGGD